MSTPTWTTYRWRCHRKHRHPLPATDEAMRRALARVARRRGRWLVVESGNGFFGQAASLGCGVLGVELSSTVAKVAWPLRLPSGRTRSADSVWLIGASPRQAPIDFPPGAQLSLDEAATVLCRHLRGEGLPGGFATVPVEVR